jgi:hypothetical protein
MPPLDAWRLGFKEGWLAAAQALRGGGAEKLADILENHLKKARPRA